MLSERGGRNVRGCEDTLNEYTLRQALYFFRSHGITRIFGERTVMFGQT